MYTHKTKLRVNCPIIRNRSSPNTFFIAIIQNEYERKINKFIKNYAEVMENVDLVNL